MTIRVGDIDIDFADRSQVLKHIEHTAATMINSEGQWEKHRTGVYVTDIPTNPFTGSASIDYIRAEDRGYVKIDLLNNSVYQLVRDRQHLIELTNQPVDWTLLQNPDFFSQVVHIGNHYSLFKRLVEPITTIEHMAMFLALIRPAKRGLVGLSWHEIEQSVWTKSSDGTYGFKKSHAMSYSLLVAVHINLLNQSV